LNAITGLFIRFRGGSKAVIVSVRTLYFMQIAFYACDDLGIW
jgi:hypothetical protein